MKLLCNEINNVKVGIGLAEWLGNAGLQREGYGFNSSCWPFRFFSLQKNKIK